MIEDHCIENDIIAEVEETLTAETAEGRGKPNCGNCEVLRLKLEFEREERRKERKEAQRARKAAEKACNVEKALPDAQLAETQKARDLRLAEL